MDCLTPKDHGEEVAVFRHSIIGELLRRELEHGERSAILRNLSEQRVRPPGSDLTRCYSVPTLERWLYDFKRGGLAALVPQTRSDGGRGRDLDAGLRELLCDIRREHPNVSVTVILRTLRADGRVGDDVKECTVRRMFAERGLVRTAPVDGSPECAGPKRQPASRNVDPGKGTAGNGALGGVQRDHHEGDDGAAVVGAALCERGAELAGAAGGDAV